MNDTLAALWYIGWALVVIVGLWLIPVIVATWGGW